MRLGEQHQAMRGSYDVTVADSLLASSLWVYALRLFARETSAQVSQDSPIGPVNEWANEKERCSLVTIPY